MKPQTWIRVFELFRQAVELEAEERTRFVEERCGEDRELRAELERLLAVDAKASPLDDSSAVSLAGLIEPATGLELGSRIGHYQVKRVLAAGGMGTVYEAEQSQPRRRVALKTLRPGALTEMGLRRFRLEAEILGSLNHPSIAQIYDSGTHRDGDTDVHFIGMEYIAGSRDILSFAEAEGLSLRARLELFLQVCDAVQHGHQRGVIHRDLKPSNVLIDEHGTPKVIDFGIARVTDRELFTLTSMATETGRAAGTLLYMSPEQLSGRNDEIDTRSDVYALGVILFQLCSDAFPFDVEGLAFAQMVHELSTNEPRRLNAVAPEVGPDLDWVTAQAMDRDPDRRYGSVGALADDVRRFLRHQPVTARPPSSWYRVRRLVRRHRLAFGAVAAIAAVALVGLLATLWQAEQARRRAEERNVQLELAGAANGFLERALRSIRPEVAMGQAVPLQQFIDQTAAELERAPPEHAEVEANVRRTLGDTYLSLGTPELGVVQLERAAQLYAEVFGEADERALETRLSLASGYFEKGQRSRAVEEIGAVLATAEENAGPMATVTLRARLALARSLFDPAESEAELRQLVERIGNDPAHANIALAARHQIAQRLVARGEYDAASAEVQAVREARGSDRDALDPTLLDEELQDAAILADASRPAAAAELFEDLVPRMETLYGPEHPRTLDVRARLTYAWALSGRADAARSALDELERAFAQVKGRETRHHAHGMFQAGAASILVGRRASAQNLLRESLTAYDRSESQPTVDVHGVAVTYASLLVGGRQFDEAQELLDRCREEAEGLLPPGHWLHLQRREIQSALRMERGELAAARDELREVVATYERHFPRDNPAAVSARGTLGAVLVYAGDMEAAERVLAEAYEIEAELAGPDSNTALHLRAYRAFALGRLGQRSAALGALDDIARLRALGWGEDFQETVLCRLWMGQLLLEEEDVEGGRWLIEGVLGAQIRAEFRTEARFLLAISHMSQGEWDRARQLLAEAEQLALLPSARVWASDEVAVLQATLDVATGRDPASARARLESGFEALRSRLGDEHWKTARARALRASIEASIEARPAAAEGDE